MMETDSFYCRVCGLYLGYQPWGEDGRTLSYNILCCGVEFGYEDDSINYWIFIDDWISVIVVYFVHTFYGHKECMATNKS